MHAADHAAFSVDSTAITDNTIRSQDVFTDSLNAGDLAGNSVGSDELKGIIVRVATVVVPGNSAENGSYLTRQVTVDCQSGEQLIGGGAGWNVDPNNDLELTLVASRPSSNGWLARGGSDVGFDATLQVRAMCLVL